MMSACYTNDVILLLHAKDFKDITQRYMYTCIVDIHVLYIVCTVHTTAYM